MNATSPIHESTIDKSPNRKEIYNKLYNDYIINSIKSIENNDYESSEIQTFLPGGQKVKLERILGSGSDFECLTNSKGKIRFWLAGKFSYGLFHYVLDSDKIQ